MHKANQIVNSLLETDFEDPGSELLPGEAEEDLAQLIMSKDQDITTGRITRDTAMKAHEFYHRESALKGKAVRCRRNGATKTWVRQPDKFKIPVKYGLYDYFYIDNDNASEWSTVPVALKLEPKAAKKKRVINPSSLMPPLP